MKPPSAERSEAEEAVFSVSQQEALQSWTTYYPYPIMGLLEALRAVQLWHLCIKPEHEAYLARLFGAPVSHVHQVATFFPMFTRRPAGRHRLGLCRGLSCAMAGADKIARCLEKTLGVAEGQTTPDGRFSWEEMECLGACDFAPAVIVDERLAGKATQALVEGLAKELK